MLKFLVIQTSFLGDVVLATPIAEKLHSLYPDAQIDFVVRKGNESLFETHPFIKNVWVWDKKKDKIKNLFRILKQIKAEKYFMVINCQRFLSTGILTGYSQARHRVGFDKNPLSHKFTQKIKYQKGTKEKPVHEVTRNLSLISSMSDDAFTGPKLYPSKLDFKEVAQTVPYICIAPASVWFTKQLPIDKWDELIKKQPEKYKVILLGGEGDIPLCESIAGKNTSRNMEVVAGKISLLQTAALMENAVMNFVNDSAPLHLASAMNAPVTAFFCSTATWFGFTPLSNNSMVIETKHQLSCKPCGIHGRKKCPKKHFKCGDIEL